MDDKVLLVGATSTTSIVLVEISEENSPAKHL